MATSAFQMPMLLAVWKLAFRTGFQGAIGN